MVDTPHGEGYSLCLARGKVQLRLTKRWLDDVADPDGSGYGYQGKSSEYMPTMSAVGLLCSGVEGPINLASGSPIRLRDLIEALAAAAGRPDLVRLGARPAPAGEPDELVADVTRLREEVGWISSSTLERRAADTIRWWSDALSAGALPRGAA